jgi:signal transduction histidine kinase
MFQRIRKQVTNQNLRFRMAVLVVIPIMVTLLFFSVYQYFNQRNFIEQQVEHTNIQLGDFLLGSLRDGMLDNDQRMVRDSLAQISMNPSITRIWIINTKNVVKISSLSDEENRTLQLTSEGCVQCHKDSTPDQPRVIINVSGKDELMRVATPISNQPECWTCHPSNQKYLGVLLIDSPLPAAEKIILTDLLNNLILSVCFSMLIGLGAYFIINKLVVQRIEHLDTMLKTYTGGDFDLRATNIDRRHDEITSLGQTFNQMADKLKEHEQQLAERARVRELAIVEERERIAHELHDGIAQFLGYIITKTQAAHIFLEKGDTRKADGYMRQIETETQKQAIDVRASILGLKMFSGEKHEIASDIQKYINQSNLFMNIDIVPEIDQRLENLVLKPETELQLLRIMQEAISNVLKHSFAEKARVSLEYLEGDLLKLSIRDNGLGFNLDEVGTPGQPHFGLATMRERAESIGGSFEVKSAATVGTTISVTLKLPEKDQ